MITGMLAATLIAIFLIPLLFVLIERLAHAPAAKRTAPAMLVPGERIMTRCARRAPS